MCGKTNNLNKFTTIIKIQKCLNMAISNICTIAFKYQKNEESPLRDRAKFPISKRILNNKL